MVVGREEEGEVRVLRCGDVCVRRGRRERAAQCLRRGRRAISVLRTEGVVGTGVANTRSLETHLVHPGSRRCSSAVVTWMRLCLY